MWCFTIALAVVVTAYGPSFMKLLFWVSLALTFYAYFGYALLLRVVGQRPTTSSTPGVPALPSVSVLIAARNEAANLPRKLANLRAFDYPAELLEIVIVSDGSTDATAELLSREPNVVSLLLPVAGGKANALNQAVLAARGEILLFLDARQTVDPGALRALVEAFDDPMVGAVSGELLLEQATAAGTGAATGDALGIYWKIEKSIRKLESASGSVVGVTGAIYALRRELFTPIPQGTILDDVYVPMEVIRQGRRVLFEPRAIARDRLFAEPGKEFARKVRTLTGNYQLLQLAPWLLTARNPLLFRLISHKLLRLVVPLLLLLMLLAAALTPGAWFRLCFWGQVIFYGLAAMGRLSPSTRQVKPVAIAYTFVLLNVAAALAFLYFVTGRKELWA